jgi:hypothetical protein
MQIMKKTSFPGYVLVLLMLFLTACSVEKKLARQFVSTGSQRSVLILGPEFIYKTNLKKDILDSLGIRDESLFDSVLFANSFFLKEIDDDKFLDNYLLGLEKELKVFGLNVYREEGTADFMEVDSNAFIINVAQLELEEDYYEYRDETRYYDNYFYHDHQLNSASVNSWFEISRINEESNTRKVYFASDVIIDDVEGNFTLDVFQSEVKYFYTIDTLQPDELYDYAYLLGRTYGGYTFDLLLNQYLDAQMEGDRDDRYWRYDPYLDAFFPATDDKLVPLEGN